MIFSISIALTLSFMQRTFIFLAALFKHCTPRERRLFKDRLKSDTRNTCFCSLVIWERWIKSIKRRQREMKRISSDKRKQISIMSPYSFLIESVRWKKKPSRCSNDHEGISGSYLTQKKKKKESKSSLLSLSLWQGVKYPVVLAMQTSPSLSETCSKQSSKSPVHDIELSA